MKTEFVLTLVYRGDITEQLEACGTKAPFYLDPDGNTIQFVNVFRGAGSRDISDGQFKTLTEMMLIPDARKNGEVIGWSWTPWDEIHPVEPKACQ